MAIFSDMTDSGGTGNINWGHIGGNLSDQTDLKNALDGKVNLDCSNATFSNLDTTAKDNIINTVFGGLQTTDNTKIGYLMFFGDQTKQVILPAGGSWLVNSFLVSANGETTYGTNDYNNRGIFAGGTTIGDNLKVIIGFAIKIQ
jgi:hypothetical protein